VHLLRNRPRAEVARLYQVADAYAHAATREPFGIVFLEAMASGLPIVGHPWEVTRWILGDAGTVVDMKETGALAAVLGQWARDPALRLAAGARARQRAKDVFSPARVVPQYLEMYTQMMRAVP
jgi:glycosyltransferase involved in cell wall biosynthesis